MNRLKESVIKAGKGIWNSLPILLGVILLISLANALIPKSIYSRIFNGNIFVDPLFGSIIGSILAGNPITSYVIAGELLAAGVSLIAVTAFIVSWVTVGLIQLPAESMLLGKRFAITRNITAFICSMLVALITVSLVVLI